jgi:iron(III) transport system ATP-binding protein
MLEKVTYVGSHLEFAVATEFGEVFVVSPDVDAPFAPGQPIGIGFPPRGPVLISR